MGSIEEASRFAKIAVEFDRNGNIPEAIRHYYYATNLLDSIVFKSSDSADSIKAKSEEYRKRAAQLGEKYHVTPFPNLSGQSYMLHSLP